MLRAYLPPKVGVGTGFIACGGTNPRQSPQCDIILFDALNNAPLYSSEAWSIYPIEMVYAVIEVKTSLNTATLRDAFRKCAVVRRMAASTATKGNKSYRLQLPPVPGRPARPGIVYDRLPPRFFVFSYGGWNSAAALDKNFRKQTKENENAHIHGICTLHKGGSFYVGHLAYRAADDRASPVSQQGFRNFLMALPQTLNSMLPAHRLGNGFDQANLAHYSLLPAEG
jgi:hypothetical protein